jgi:hypothetical protein
VANLSPCQGPEKRPNPRRWRESWRLTRPTDPVLVEGLDRIVSGPVLATTDRRPADTVLTVFRTVTVTLPPVAWLPAPVCSQLHAFARWLDGSRKALILLADERPS